MSLPSGGQLPPPSAIATLTDLLAWRAHHEPAQRAFTFLEDGQTETASCTYMELHQRAGILAARLGDMAGKRVLLLCPPGLEYITSFFGCLYAGATAVPAYPPEPNRAHRTLPRLRAIVADAQVAAVLTTPAVCEMIMPFMDSLPELRAVDWVLVDLDDLANTAFEPTQCMLSADDLAFLMYTSGSTGTPKGVMVSHGNALHNAAHFPGFFGRPCEGVVSWLPLFHDLGLFLGIIHPLYRGVLGVLMPPAAFVQHPLRWLQALSTYRATISGGPNFAYELCVRKTTPEQRATLDLSHWKIALNGAEPVRAETLERFAATFERCGFRRDALYPSYGLSDATATVAGAHHSTPPMICTFDRSALQQNCVMVRSASEDVVTLVGCGKSMPDQTIAVVDPHTGMPCAPEQVGEIWIHGPSIARGYWRRPEETAHVFGALLSEKGPFLRTGDLGFMYQDELFITGRLKDLIVIRGQNHYPEDIEQTIERSHTQLRAGCGAAFSIDVADEEQLVVVYEIDPSVDQGTAIQSMRQALLDQHGVDAYTIMLIAPGSLPKTSSGKVQRHACREAFLEQKLVASNSWCATPVASEVSSQTTAPANARSATEIHGWLRSRFADGLGIAPQTLDTALPFTRYGLDSAQALGLAGDLATWLGRPLSPTLAWDYPTIDALAAHLAQESLPTAQPNVASGTDEPIAIIGMGCRFPKAPNLDAFWTVLHEGVDAITEVPANRWDVDALYDANPKRPGTMTTRWGGFLDDIDQFDAEFFGISPREAQHLDPQQRLLLEVSWEALEHAGHAPTALAGSLTGVFIGICNSDHARRELRQRSAIGPYGGSGTAYSIAANRISYTLDLRGPSMAIDTACSSSLVAVHLACQSLRSGESQMALAGGVNLILDPEISIAFSKAQMMAADGRCKTYDASADGYVRAEGCGMLVLKRLSAALNDGDHVLALIGGSAVNQDGKSNGITAPNGAAQQAVIQQALYHAGITAAQLDYIEAHGTGTPLGDAIEAQALAAVLSSSEHHGCVVGSVKTNIGHAEAAAGVAGIIKVVLAIQHGEIPAHLHIQQLNPHIAVQNTPLHIPTERQPWMRGERTRRAGVSSFGFGGTNAHVVLQEAPVQIACPSASDRTAHVLMLSARNEHTLSNMAGAVAKHMEMHPELNLADVCYTANVGRSTFPCRFGAVAHTTEQMQRHLIAFAKGKQSSDVITQTLHSFKPPKIAWMFTGQGAQYVGMGRQLYETQPVFRAALEKCAALLQPHMQCCIITELYETEAHATQLDETWLTQPALFALEYALAQLWLSWGITPDAVFGHSVGEYVAACIAGVFSLEDATKLIAARAHLMHALPGDGAMVAVMSTAETIAPLLEPFASTITVAAFNGPTQLVLTGHATALEQLLPLLDAQEIGHQRLAVSHAFHSALMEPMLPEFAETLREVRFLPPRIPLVSNVTGTPLDDAIDATYWLRHVREPVRFAQSVDYLAQHGTDIFLEVGPKAVLCGMVRRIVGNSTNVLTLSSLVGQPQIMDDWTALATSAAHAVVHGCPLDWAAFENGFTRHKVVLPTYPFERQQCWYKPEALPQQGTHPLVDDEVIAPQIADAVFQKHWHVADEMWLNDHCVGGTPMLPGAAFLEMVRAACRSQQSVTRLVNIVMVAPLVPQDSMLSQVHIAAGTHDHSFSIMSCVPSDRIWGTHATGTLYHEPLQLPALLDIAALRADCTTPLSAEDLYAGFERTGIVYGSCFRAVEQAWIGSNSVFAELCTPAAAAHLHNDVRGSIMLDGALQSFGALFVTHSGETYVPFAIDEIAFFDTLPSRLFVYAIRRDGTPDSICGDLQMLDEHGRVLVALRGLHLRRANLQADKTANPLVPVHDLNGWFHQIRWQPTQIGMPCLQPHRTWLILCDESGIGATLRERLVARGDRCVIVTPGSNFVDQDDTFVLDPRQSDQYHDLVRALQVRGYTPDGVIHLWSCGAPKETNIQTIDDELYNGVYSLLFLTRALTEQSSGSLLFGIVSSYGQAIDDTRPLVPARASLWGLGKVIAYEHEHITCIGIDLETEQATSTSVAAQILTEIDGAVPEASGGSWVAYQGDTRLQAILEPCQVVPQRPLPLREGGVYLITGGQGGVGLEIARFIAERVSARLILVNRTLPDPERHPERVAGIRALELLGAEVLPVAADVTDVTALHSVVMQAEARWGHIDGVIHSAGVLHDGMVWGMNQERFDMAFRPKVHGTLALAEAVATSNLDFFVLCSSMAALRPAPGQSNHVAANSFEDAFAHYACRVTSSRFMAINWGLWGETGVVASDHYLKLLAAKGIHAFSNAQGISGFCAALQSEATQLAFLNPGAQNQAHMAEEKQTMAHILDEVRPHLPSLWSQFNIDHYETMAEPLHEVSLAYILRGLSQLGWQFEADAPVTTAELHSRLRIVPEHYHLFNCLLAHMHNAGVLRRTDDTWIVDHVPTWTDPVHQLQTLLAIYPDFEAELSLLQRCGGQLAEVLRGADPLPLLFPGGSLANSDSIYQHSVFSRLYQTIMQQTVAAVCAHLPENQPLRILELGAGTGGTTAHVLSVVPADRTQYTFTDISSMFLHNAQEKFRAFPFVEYRRLDIERDPAQQTFDLHSFDIVIAANVLHATGDLANTLHHVHQLLKSSGLLLLLELVRPHSWLDLTFGLTSGWWRCAMEHDSTRQQYPLLSLEGWQHVLYAHGFVIADGVPLMAESAKHPAAQAVVLAQRSVEHAPEILHPVRSPQTSESEVDMQREFPVVPEGARGDNLRFVLQQLLAEQIVTALQLSTRHIPLDQSFHALGLDSLLAVEIVSTLKERLGIPLSPTSLFEHPSVEAFSDYLLREHGAKLAHRFAPAPVEIVDTQPPLPEPARIVASPTAARVVAPPVQPLPPISTEQLVAAAPTDDAIAIVGMACRFPGAPNLDSFWQLLSEGRNAVSEVPVDRWDWREHFDATPATEGKTYSRWGGFLDQIDQFDPRFFNISPKEAPFVDPQQRLFMEIAWQTLEHAGYAGERLADSDTGVFVGCSYNHYFQMQQRLALHEAQNYFAALGNSNAILANRVSFFFNFHGPSVVVDTLCSSSLVALHMACQSLRSGECSSALVGGVNILLTPDHHITMSQIKAYAADGQCKAFDDQANGFVSGEGVGAVLLKPLSQALVDRDTVYATIRGSAVTHNGRTNGMTAPTPRYQAQAIQRAHRAARVAPESISYVEAHGTGTMLGDPIEIDGLCQAFGDAQSRDAVCHIGSVKTNLGHLEAAAGIAGLIKVVLSLQHYQIPASLHFDEPNKLIHFEDTPFRVNTSLRPWKTHGSRCAGLSSFGMGGVNAHIVLEEAPLELSMPYRQPQTYLLPLSARSEEALLVLVQRYYAFVDTHTDLVLADLCYTASTGRAHFKHRLAITARTRAELRHALQGLCENGIHTDLPEGVYAGQAAPAVMHDQQATAGGGSSMQSHELAQRYIQGHLTDWEKLYAAEPARRIALPDYPFERQHWWFGEEAARIELPAAREEVLIASAARANPLRGRRQQ